MGKVDQLKYMVYLEQLARITHEEPFNRDSYVTLIREISGDYDLAKGTTEFYPTPMAEQMGRGEYFCDVDNKKPNKVLIRLRFVTSTKAIIIGTLYVNEDAGEYDETDIQQLDMLYRLILGFVARRRLIKTVEEFGYSDLDGYLNFRAFARYLDINNVENKLAGKLAFHFDMHNFTMVNQEIGRENADFVMHEYYDMLSEAIGDSGIITRLGGDKFIGVFDKSVQDKVFRIFSGVRVPYDEKGRKKIKLSVAAGVYVLPTPFMLKVYGDVMDKIMVAGNIAKGKSSGSIVFFSEEMLARKEHVKKLQNDFLSAMMNEEFAAYYQPKVDIETGEIIGAEALCRWLKDDKVIPPNDFIPILELNSFIIELDFYMLDLVCSHIRKWLDEGRKAVRVSVNFSRNNLIDAELPEKIISVIDRYEVPHELVEIEFTETTMDVMFSDLKRVVCGLQEAGVWTAVDDFGVGYSSLNLIRDIPWDVLKVDKSLIPEEGDEESIANKMFRHVIALSQDLGLKCVIEGVEKIEQLDILKKNGCRIAQGYFFDMPLPIKVFEERLDGMNYNV